ncbi:MAG: hypothetical protein LDL41_24060 [Coleofasciculus sp. S288]|nr:hypothetical protein [Coleofasciculus sp. S288]
MTVLLIVEDYYYRIPVTAFYAGEHVQPQTFDIDRGIHVAVNPKFQFIIPIFSYRTVSEDKFILVREDLGGVNRIL